jgi:hypothetical protein
VHFSGIPFASLPSVFKAGEEVAAFENKVNKDR